jgi:hypothetical protein
VFAQDSISTVATFVASVSEGVHATDTIVGQFLWNEIDDTQTPNWQNITNTQSPGWSEISDVQTPNWQEIVI